MIKKNEPSNPSKQYTGSKSYNSTQKLLPVTTTTSAKGVVQNASLTASIASGGNIPIVGGASTDKIVTNVPSFFVDLIAAIAVVSSCACMVLTQGRVVDISTWFTSLFGPYCAYQKRQLRQLGSMRELSSNLRDEANRLTKENEHLKGSIDSLESSVKQLNETEKQLSKIAKTSDVDRLVSTVNKYKTVTRQIEENLKAKVVQMVLKIVLSSDRNFNFKMNPQEIDILVLRMSYMQIAGVDFHAERFRKKLAKKEVHNITSVMDIFQHLFDESVPKDEQLFTLDPVAILRK